MTDEPKYNVPESRSPDASEALRAEGLDWDCAGAQDQQSHTFAGARNKRLDEKAEETFQAAKKQLSKNPTQGFRLIREHCNWNGKSAVEKLTGDGGLDIAPSEEANNVAVDVSTLAERDPKKSERQVPVEKPANKDEAVYLTEDGQRYLLAFNSVHDPKGRIPIDNGKFASTLEVELAWRADPSSISPETAHKLHKNVDERLGEVFDSSYKDTVAERQQIAAQHFPALNANEVGALYQRLKEARSAL